MLNIEGNDIRLNAIEEIKALRLPVFIWGGQTYSQYVIEYLRANNFFDELKIVVDDEYVNEESDSISLSEYLKTWADKSIMIFGFYNYEVVQAKYEIYKSKIKYLYDFRVAHVGDHLLKWDRDEIAERMQTYEKTYGMLKDNMSKLTMQLYLRAAVNGEFAKLWSTCYEEVAYYNTITENLQINTLVDCGAFNGDDIHDFIRVFPKYKKIYALEPDEKNVSQLKARIEIEKIDGVEVIPKGVYRTSTVLHFSSDHGVASHIDENGEVEVPVVAIDEILEDCNDNIFIKMDIEGSEIDALVGARRTIMTQHPCLAICVYHKEEDLCTIPLYIASLVDPDTYDYYLRFHGHGLAELVFYAVPK